MIEFSIKKKLDNFVLEAELADSGFICVSGKNGSGKTTLLNCIAGIYKIDSGWIKINGKDITSLPIYKRKVVLTNYTSYIPHLTVDEHLVFGLKFKKKGDSSILHIVREKLGIKFNSRVNKLSLGNRSKISLATALISLPNVILVDELFSNLDNKEEFMINYKEIARSNKIDVIYTTQHNEDALYADHHYVVNEGQTKKII